MTDEYTQNQAIYMASAHLQTQTFLDSLSKSPEEDVPVSLHVFNLLNQMAEVALHLQGAALEHTV